MIYSQYRIQMPRRKYGHLIMACPPTPQEKCRACRLGIPCPVHDNEKAPDYETLANKKRRRHSGKKGKKHQSKASKEKTRSRSSE